MEWLLEIVLVILLAATLFHALRLERALGVLKSDRVALKELVEGFNASTRAAEQGIARLRAAADGAGRNIARQSEAAQALKDDLQFLAERGERLADRLEMLVRAGRVLAQEPARPVADGAEPYLPAEPPAQPEAGARPARSRAERDLLRALRLPR
jgi:chromosome segregation ATPase